MSIQLSIDWTTTFAGIWIAKFSHHSNQVGGKRAIAIGLKHQNRLVKGVVQVWEYLVERSTVSASPCSRSVGAFKTAHHEVR